jgi:hypothetical protein
LRVGLSEELDIFFNKSTPQALYKLAQAERIFCAQAWVGKTKNNQALKGRNMI